MKDKPLVGKAPSLRGTTGAIVWEGPSPFDGSPIVAIVTWKSSNRKTGQMSQLWILRADVSPLEAIATGADSAICGNCPLRGMLGRERACYVVIGKAPLTVWNAYRKGRYPRLAPKAVGAILAGHKIRLGAYGDPAMVPLAVLRAIVAHSALWTGYTHQWRTRKAYRGLLMASADNEAGRLAATRAGWRVFHVVPVGSALPPGTVECAATRVRNPLQCVDCGMCSGTRNGAVAGAVSVAIVAHGSGAKYV